MLAKSVQETVLNVIHRPANVCSASLVMSLLPMANVWSVWEVVLSATLIMWLPARAATLGTIFLQFMESTSAVPAWTTARNALWATLVMSAREGTSLMTRWANA